MADFDRARPARIARALAKCGRRVGARLAWVAGAGLMFGASLAQAQSISTIAGNGSFGFSGDGGPATNAQFANAEAVAMDASGAIYVADSSNSRIRRFTPGGTITTVAGGGSGFYPSGDGGPATQAVLGSPSSVLFDGGGNLYFSAYGRVRKVTPGGTISTIVGPPALGEVLASSSSGDGGPATQATLTSSGAMAFGPDGSLYLVDGFRVRRVDPAGIITTVAGNGIQGYSPPNNVQATQTSLNYILGLAVDAAGNLYLSDYNGSTILKVSPAGLLTRFAGGNGMGYNGDGGPAITSLIGGPSSLAFDAGGTLYFADATNHRVRSISNDGILRTVVGTGTSGYSGDGGPPLQANINYPRGLLVSPAGALVFTDFLNHRIRRATYNAPSPPSSMTADPGNAMALVDIGLPADSGGLPPTYLVSSHPAGGVDLDAGSALLRHRLTSLVNGSSYTFTATATNAAGTSASSAPSAAVAPQPVPGVPTGVTAALASSKITVSFAAPASAGGSPITGYTVSSQPAGGIDTQAGSTSLSHTMSGLVVGTSYTFSVRASNASGTGLASAPSAAVVFNTAPNAPTSVTAKAYNGYALISFVPPVNTGGLPISNYTVVSSPAGGVDNGASVYPDTRQMGNLVNGTTYTFTMKAYNAQGASVSSAPSNAVKPAAVPSEPTAVFASGGNAQATVTFNPPNSTGGSAITSYIVTASPAGGVDQNAGTNSLSHLFTGLTNGVSYVFTAAAKNTQGTGPSSFPSNEVIPKTVPTAPIMGSVSAVPGTSLAAVSFSPPVSDGGGPVSFYSISSNPIGAFDFDSSTNKLTHTMGGMVVGTTYTFSVTATNAAGTSPASAPSNGFTLLPAQLSIEDLQYTELSYAPAGSKAALMFRVNLSPTISTPVSFDISTADGTALSGSDYEAVPLQHVTIPAGNSYALFFVYVYTDFDFEQNETFFANISNVVGATLLDGQGQATILNDDAPTISISDSSVVEGDSGSKLMHFTVSLAQPATGPVTYNAYAFGDTASASTDFEGVILYGETIAAGETSRDFAVPIYGDLAPESDETFSAFIGNVSGATVADANGIGKIIDDDSPRLSVSDVNIVEGNTGTKQAVFNISLAKPSAAPVGFDISTNGGTAASGVDFLAQSALGQSIPAGQTSATFSVTINGDTKIEGNETFTANLGNVSGASIADGQGLGTIGNDDLAGLSIADVTLSEGDEGASTARFVVSLDNPLPTPVTFDIATSNGSATSGSDYVARNQVGRVIDAGRSRVVFEVEVNGDLTSEANETFGVTLSNASGASLVDGTATGTIQNDDAAAMPIAKIQGSGPVSPLVGQTVVTEGIVTALITEGFVIQSPDAAEDGDLATSEGLFVAGAASNVAMGDSVRVSGRVQEVRVGDSLQQLTSTQLLAGDIRRISQGHPLPRPHVLDSGNAGADQAANGLERFEGMRVSLPRLRVVAPVEGAMDPADGLVHSNGRFYGVVEGIARPFREPGLSVLEHPADRSGARPVSFDANPERLMVFSTGQRGAAALSADVGDSITGITGVLGYGDASYRVLPDPASAIAIRSGASPRPVSKPAPSEVSIGSYNLRRLVDDIRSGNEPVLTSPRYAARLAKTANAICVYARNPDILGVSEVESRETLGDLAAASNANDGNLLFTNACGSDAGYRAYQPADAGRNAQGFLVSTREVRPGVPRVEVLGMVALDDALPFHDRDGGTEPLHVATPLLLRTRVNSTGAESFEVSVLALRLSPRTQDSQSTDAHGWPSHEEYLRAKRAAQALSVAQWIQSRQRAHPGEKLVVLGDLDSNEFDDGHVDLLGVLSGREAPANRVLQHIGSPVSPPLENLSLRLPRNERYTTTREGNAQALSHVLVNSALLNAHRLLRVEVARIDADFGEDNADDTGVPMRSSDQDPAVLFIGVP